MEKIKLGIIGIGHLGKYHLEVAKQIPWVYVQGIYDKNFSRMKEMAIKYRVNSFSSVEELISKCDAVSIVVPTESHYEIGLLAIEGGCHIFIEKPITATLEQGKKLIELARKKQKKIQVGHIERFNPAFLSLKDIELAPLFIEAHRLSEFNPRGTDVSVILDLMIHDLDIILKLVNSPINFVHACGVSVVSPSEDIANVRIEFKNGAVANLTASRISAKHMRKMRLFQKDQYISIDFLEKRSEILSLKDISGLKDRGYTTLHIGEIGDFPRKRDIYFISPPALELNSLKLELEEFAKAIINNTEVPVTGEQGLYALELAYKIIQLMKKPNRNDLE